MSAFEAYPKPPALSYPASARSRYSKSSEKHLASYGYGRMDVSLEPAELTEEAYAELTRILDKFSDHPPLSQELTQNEYPLTPGSFFRGTTLGVVIATLYTQIYGLLRPAKGVSTLVESHWGTSSRYAYPPKPQFDINGFGIPDLKPIVLEFRPDLKEVAVGASKFDTGRSSAHGSLVPFLSLADLTDACKKYILEILDLDEESYAHKVLSWDKKI